MRQRVLREKDQSVERIVSLLLLQECLQKPYFLKSIILALRTLLKLRNSLDNQIMIGVDTNVSSNV